MPIQQRRHGLEILEILGIFFPLIYLFCFQPLLTSLLAQKEQKKKLFFRFFFTMW